MSDNNEEVKKAVDETFNELINPKPEEECCNKPDACEKPVCPDKLDRPEVNEPNIIVPDGLDIDLDDNTTDLKAKLDDLFRRANNAKAERRETISTESVNPNDFKEVEVGEMKVKLPKNSALSQETLARIMAETDEMDCGDEDDDGNKIDHEIDNGPAKTEYKAGQLRGLKEKFYANDTSGQEAQARLENRDLAHEGVVERFREHNEQTSQDIKEAQKKASKHRIGRHLSPLSEPTAETVRPRNKILTAQEIAELPKSRKERLIANRNGGFTSVPADAVDVETVDSSDDDVWFKLALMGQWAIEKQLEASCGKQPSSFDDHHRKVRIDYNIFSDSHFKAKCKKLATELKRLELQDGTEMLVPWSWNVNDALKLLQATHPVENKPQKARLQKLNEKMAAAQAELAALQAEDERIARLTRDIMPISPIENPSLARRTIRTIRRTWKRFQLARQSIARWWRL